MTVREDPTRPWAGRWAFYEGLDGYCSPSRVEGGPLPVFEAAAVGVPVVTTRVVMAVALVDGGGAWEGDPEDPDRLAGALRSVTQATPDERVARQTAAVAVTASFGATPGVPRYEALYTDVLDIGLPEEGRPAVQPQLELQRDRRRAVAVRYRNARTTVHRMAHGPDTSPYPSAP